MILLNPFALLFALAIGLVLLLHFRRPKRIQHVSNLHLWQASGDESISKRPVLERIRRNWLLILQVLFLASLILALARPSILVLGKPRLIAFVIDCSASMNAREQGRTRFDLAIERATKLLDDVGSNDRILIVQGRPQSVSNIYSGSDKSAIKQALKGLSLTEAPVDLNDSLITALSAVQKAESYEVFIFSDGTQELPLLAQDARIRYIQIGASDNNAAITRFSVRCNPFSSYDRQIYAEVANFSDHPKDLQFEMFLEGATLISEKVKLGQKERRPFAVQAPPAGRGNIRSRIDVKDDMDADNTAYAVLDRRKITVLLITEGNEFVEKALNVNPQIFCTTKTPEEFSQKDLQGGYDLIILDRFEPQLLPPANYFIIKLASARVGRDSLVNDVTNLVSLQPRHPVMTFVNLAKVVVEEALPLQIPSSGSALIEGNGKPLLMASEMGAFRNVTLGFDIHSSNLPLTLSFPILISNIVNWLSSETGDPGNQLLAGDLLRRRLPFAESGNSAAVTDPKGVVTRVSLVNGILSFAGTEKTGIYSVENGKTAEQFAVNLFSEQESNIKPVFIPTSGKVHSSAQPALSSAGREIWRVLLFVALALLMLEWLHYHRTRTA